MRAIDPSMIDAPMTGDDLKAWRTRMGWTQVEAARQLGISRVQYNRLEVAAQRGDGRNSEISRSIGLACCALEHLDALQLDAEEVAVQGTA